MGRIVVYLYGKPKEKSYLTIINEYYKRLKGRGISLSYYSDKNKSINYENMLLNLKGNLILIDENGEELSSKDLSLLISKIIMDHTTTNFALGPPDGFSEGFKSKIHQSISLSPMTFPHEMAASIFIEQLYRATEIIKGTTYHRE